MAHNKNKMFIVIYLRKKINNSLDILSSLCNVIYIWNMYIVDFNGKMLGNFEKKNKKRYIKCSRRVTTRTCRDFNIN